MSTKMLVTMKLDQRLTMSQQLRQAITLMQYTTLDLKQLVQQTLETNPLLELVEQEIIEPLDENENFSQAAIGQEDEAAALKYTADLVKRNTLYQHNEESELENYSLPESLRAHLLEQTLLCQFTQTEQRLAENIIDAIDDKGYLILSLDEIAHIAVEQGQTVDVSQVEHMLKIVQGFDPLGVGARDLRECLLLQLQDYPQHDAAWQLAMRILMDYAECLAESNTKKMLKKLNVTPKEYANALTLIRTLDPAPGERYTLESRIYVEPELYVEKRKNTWCVFLTESILTNLKINHQYQELIRENKRNGSYGTLRKELDEARFLLKGLQRRNETLLAVGRLIVEMQKDFFELGPAHMKSMNIADVAQALNIHESTVSRVTTEKYIATPRGVFELKYFFPSHVSTKTGDVCSATAVKALIQKILAAETDAHILSDEEIAVKLKEQGINIARRTVAKYREAMHILPSYQRCVR